MDTEIDLAIRTREFEPDSNITTRKLAETKRVLAASRAYLAERGRPRTVEDLLNQDLQIYSHASQPRVIQFTKGKESKVIEIDAVLECNDGQIIRVHQGSRGHFDPTAVHHLQRDRLRRTHSSSDRMGAAQAHHQHRVP